MKILVRRTALVQQREPDPTHQWRNRPNLRQPGPLLNLSAFAEYELGDFATFRGLPQETLSIRIGRTVRREVHEPYWLVEYMIFCNPSQIMVPWLKYVMPKRLPAPKPHHVAPLQEWEIVRRYDSDVPLFIRRIKGNKAQCVWYMSPTREVSKVVDWFYLNELVRYDQTIDENHRIIRNGFDQ